MASCRIEIDELRDVAQTARRMATSENLMVSVAGDRISAIVVDLLLEIAPMEIDGPWQVGE